MVRTRKGIYVGNQEVKRRYIGNKLIFENLGDVEDIIDDKDKVSGAEIFTDKADDSVVHVEVDGKSYRDGEPTPDYPIEIHSLNDFDVVSSVGGRNLIISSDVTPGAYINSDGSIVNSALAFITGFIEVKANEIYTISMLLVRNGYSRIAYYDLDKNFIKRDLIQNQEITQIKPEQDGFIRWSPDVDVSISDYVPGYKIEKGTTSTDWTPAPEDIAPDTDHPLIDKINLSLSEPLRSVGNVKDRLFRDSDGLWKIERNVEPIHPEDGTRTIEETYGVLDSPIYEVLPQDYQDKLNNLRSFRDSNYVYTIINDISPTVAENLKPTLHATFKSKGWYDDYQ